MSVVIKGDSNVNLDFTTGGRITGDFSNATVASRVMFQTSTVNGATRVNAIPNGTSQISDVTLWNNSDTTNAANARMFVSSGAMGLVSQISGTGTYLPITLDTGGSERVRIDTSGNVGIGTSSPTSKLHIESTSAESFQIGYSSTKRSRFGTTSAGDLQIYAYETAVGYKNILLAVDVGTAGGNVGIGTSSPSTRLDVSQANAKSATGVWQIQTFDSTSQTTGVGGGISFSGYKTAQSAAEVFAGIDGYKENATAGNAAGALRFHTQPSGGTGLVERARITSGGSLYVGITSNTGVATGSSTNPGIIIDKGASQFQCNVNANQYWSKASGYTSSDFTAHYVNGNYIGGIQTNGTITIYATASDYRLKTVIGPVLDAGQRIDALKPVEYTWNSDGSRTRGFLAHQFQEVYAASVSGTKDAVNAEGKPAYQAMQASSSEVIADLVAEIQSLRARVAQLEAK